MALGSAPGTWIVAKLSFWDGAAEVVEWFVKLGKTQAGLGFFPMNPRAENRLGWSHARKGGRRGPGTGRIQTTKNNMKDKVETETNAAAQAVGRELITSALQRNPIVAVASALIGPILGLFRRPPAAPAAGKDAGRNRRSPHRDRTMIEGQSKDKRRIIEGPPGKHPSPVRTRATSSARCITHVNVGGHSHG